MKPIKQDNREIKTINHIKKLYKGWSFEDAINDLMNNAIEKHNKDRYPMWFLNQFERK
jgi:hypothetical protein